ncbi:MAG TPA: ATP-binding cassette domain-containing protein [Actinomycetes bacterium]|nr:ATP-binding cassette domain-containing protein [Actinomycetes bacterium]
MMTTHTMTTTQTAAVPPSRAPVLQVTGLTKTFGQGELAVTAVAGVDLDVHPGEVVLIMGPSGSGKTTLLLMLGAMLRPTAGLIEVAGLDLARASERRLPALRAHRFGFVFQDFNLLSALTVAENVELACNLAGTTSHRAHQRARVLLERVGLGQRLGFRPEQLSGGEKQRVAIARALANDPPVILADEPTANLDSAIGRDVARLLRQLATEDGRAVVIVSHDARLEAIADRVLWLEDGTFRELATMATDPVCGMSVAQHDQPHLQLNGTVWWFCTTACREEFAADPSRFTSQPSPPRPVLGDDEPQPLRRHGPITSITDERPGADAPTGGVDEEGRA